MTGPSRNIIYIHTIIKNTYSWKNEFIPQTYPTLTKWVQRTRKTAQSRPAALGRVREFYLETLRTTCFLCNQFKHVLYTFAFGRQWTCWMESGSSQQEIAWLFAVIAERRTLGASSENDVFPHFPLRQGWHWHIRAFAKSKTKRVWSMTLLARYQIWFLGSIAFASPATGLFALFADLEFAKRIFLLESLILNILNGKSETLAVDFVRIKSQCGGSATNSKENDVVRTNILAWHSLIPYLFESVVAVEIFLHSDILIIGFRLSETQSFTITS